MGDISIDTTLIIMCAISGLIGFIVGGIVNGYRSREGETYLFKTPHDAWEYGKEVGHDAAD